ncbi:Phosphatidylglycerophosphate synthase [Roseivivax halotolerans]|uniref:Phosphatidylglycerophosphate synthase n=1 Tax=Roseivivax halotolerans TaxID=93684 RepID=A0A1I5Y8Z5_9RHOB|nr:CDP-alcohol phosphatidyltransferase family protein [Roseivivax halotolerans]SFQ40387.1 Phosphatidylglycerophosphate synthase [Roseivivax halotolerans]
MVDVHQTVTQDPRPLRAPSGPGAAFIATALLGAGGVAAVSSFVLDSGSAASGAAVLAYLLAAAIVFRALMRSYPHSQLGICNFVTLVRLVLVAALVSVVLAGGAISWTLFATACVALALDGVDGWAARRQGLSSAFGARFDMEVDSALGLVLAFNAAMTGPAAAIILGLPRYAFLIAGYFYPWLMRNLPDRFSRKAVCVLQLGALIALQAPILPDVLAAPLVGFALLALALSFGRDIIWLWRTQR